MNPMRFATAIPNFSKRKGGAERYLVDLCTRMADEGFEVHVYAENREERLEKIQYHPVRTVRFSRSLRLLSFALRATSAMKKENYDVTLGVGNTLEADVLQPHGGVHWAWLLRSLKAYENPVFRVVKFLGRVLSPKQWVNGWIEDAPYEKRNLKRIIAISDMVKEDMVRWYKIAADRITVVYNGVDTERFHPRNRKHREEIRRRHGIDDEFVMLFVSNNFRMKGLRHLIRVLSRLNRDRSHRLKLLVLGRDRREAHLRLARREKISGDLIFAGSTDAPELYYGAADLLVHPSFYDACSLTVLEALASGLPVITSSSNGAGGIITEGKEGFVLADPRDEQILAERIRYFLDPGIREESSRAARSLAEAHDLERNWKEMRQVFEGARLKREGNR